MKARAVGATLFCLMLNDLDNSFTTEPHTGLSLRRQGRGAEEGRL